MLQSGIETTTTTTGSGTFDLAAPTDPLRVGFVTGIGSGGTVFYRCEFAGAGQWEEGWGTVTAGSPDTLTRNVIRSSNSNALVNFSAGTKRIYCSALGDALRFGGIGAVPTATGTANAITVAHVPPLRVLRPGMSGRFYAGSSANTGNVTLALDALSAQSLRRADGSEIGPGVIRAGMLIRWYAHSATEIRLDDAPVGMELLGSVAPSGTPQYVEFALPAGFGSFVFDAANVKPNANAQLAFQLSLNGGSTWLTGGSDYSSGAIYNFSPGSTANAAAAQALLTASISNAHACRTRIELSPTIPGAVGSYYTSTGAGVESGGTAYALWTYGGAGVQVTTRPNRIRFFWVATTFGDIGRIAMLGVR